MTSDFDTLLRRLSAGEDLSSFEMTDAISRVMTGGCSEQQIEALLTS